MYNIIFNDREIIDTASNIKEAVEKQKVLDTFFEAGGDFPLPTKSPRANSTSPSGNGGVFYCIIFRILT